MRARRLLSNPLITVSSSPSLGDNVNGPSVIRVPEWVERPLGRYYMYFAHHKGHVIRLAYANDIGGPWTIHEPGTIHVRDTAFFRPQPDSSGSAEGFYTHVASPEIHIDNERRRIVMWVHGWWTSGEIWPEGAAARPWANQRGYGQSTQAAESRDGLRFEMHPEITRASYLRVFPFENRFYAMARLGMLLRADSARGQFAPGPNPFREGPYADRVHARGDASPRQWAPRLLQRDRRCAGAHHARVDAARWSVGHLAGRPGSRGASARSRVRVPDASEYAVGSR